MKGKAKYLGSTSMVSKAKEGEDYYFNEDGLLVFTRQYLLKRGFCCKNGCKHCPYGTSKSH
jgi:hypothetical protein